MGTDEDEEQEPVVVRCYKVAAMNVVVVRSAVHVLNVVYTVDGVIVCQLHDLEEGYEHLVEMMPWKQDAAAVFVDSAYAAEE